MCVHLALESCTPLDISLNSNLKVYANLQKNIYIWRNGTFVNTWDL